MIMKISKTEKTIFNVVWESNVDGEIFYEFYPCDTIEVARAKMTECINNVKTEGHFLNADPEDCTIESSENKYYTIFNIKYFNKRELNILENFI